MTKVVAITRLFGLIPALFVLVCTNTASAVEPGQIYVAPRAQWMDFDEETGLGNDWGFSAGVGLQIAERWALEVAGIGNTNFNGENDTLMNVGAGRVSTRGFGESQPMASNDTAAGRAENRRVITVIIQTLQNYRPR